MLSPTFPCGHPSHVPSLWLNDEVWCGSFRKEVLHSLQVSRIYCVLDDHILADSCWQGSAGPQRCPVPGLLLQHIAIEVMGGQLLLVPVSLQHVLVKFKGAQGHGREDKAASRHAEWLASHREKWLCKMCMIKRGRPSKKACLSVAVVFPSLWLMSTMCLPAVHRVGSQSCFDIRYETLPAV